MSRIIKGVPAHCPHVALVENGGVLLANDSNPSRSWKRSPIAVLQVGASPRDAHGHLTPGALYATAGETKTKPTQAIRSGMRSHRLSRCADLSALTTTD